MMESRTSTSSTPIWSVDARWPQAEIIALAASVIRSGGVVIYPTETFYGLGGDPRSDVAVEGVYRIKGRDFGKPLPLIAADKASLRKVVAKWPPAAERLAEIFWPGPLTLVLAAASLLPPRVHAHTGKIAVRISSHPVAHSLATAAGGLLISTSANASGQPPFSEPAEMSSGFLSHVDGMLDAGKLSGTLPSTIVDVTGLAPRLLRSGCIPWESIQALFGGE